MRHGIDERVVLFVAADLAHEERRVEDQASDDRGKDDDAEQERHDVAPRQHDPSHIQRRGQHDETDPERHEERDRATAPGSDAHGIRIADKKNEGTEKS